MVVSVVLFATCVGASPESVSRRCSDEKCLVRSGCVSVGDLTTGGMEPMVDDDKCSDAGTANHDKKSQYPLCWQKRAASSDRASTLHVQTHMRHGFYMHDWIIENSGGVAAYDAPSANQNKESLVVQNCVVRQDASNSEHCYVSITPDSGISQIFSIVAGKFVASWNQGVLKNAEGSESASSLKITVSGISGNKETKYHEAYRVAVSDDTLSEKPVEWMTMLSHFEIDNPDVQAMFTSVKLSNPSSGGKSVALVDDFTLWACPNTYWEGSSVNKRAEESLVCPEFQPSLVCLCHRPNLDDITYSKICVSRPAVQLHLHHGDFVPGTDFGGISYDCDCKPLSQTPPQPQEPAPQPQPSPVPTPAPQPTPQPQITAVPLSRMCGESPKLMFMCRDFSRYHPDMNLPIFGLVEGLVRSTLNTTTRKPVKIPGYKDSLTTAYNFYGWFRDNTLPKKIVYLPALPPSSSLSSSPYTYGGSDFFPFDSNQNLLANTHNYYFTCEHHGVIVYDSTATQKLTITSDDDSWVFLNDVLVSDLGGIHPPLSKTVNLNTLGLTHGAAYRLDIFFAERHPVGSQLTIESNFCMDCVLGYDSCGVCKISATAPVSEECPVDNYDNDFDYPTCDGQPGPCATGPGITNVDAVIKSTDCVVTKIDEKTYDLSLFADVENPTTDPSLLLVSMNHYSGHVRTRGTCDSILGGESYVWSDANGFWYPGFSDNVEKWNVTGNFVNANLKRYNFTRRFIIEDDYVNCKDSAGNPVVTKTHEQDSPVYAYTAHYSLVRTSPVALNNEYDGETVIYEAVCTLHVNENNNATNSVYYQHIGGRGEGHSGNVIVQTKWLNYYCIDGVDTGFVLSTCATYVTSSGSYGAKLSYKSAWFRDAITGLPKEGVLITRLEDNSTATGCNIHDVDSNAQCCQKWLIELPNELYGQIVMGNLYVEWNAIITDVTVNHQQQAVSTEVSYGRTLRACIDVNVTDVCMDGGDGRSVTVEDSVIGTMYMYNDPNFLISSSPPGTAVKKRVDPPTQYPITVQYNDCEQAYAKIKPNLSEKACKYYEMTVLDAYLSDPSDTAAAPIYVYHRDSPTFNVPRMASFVWNAERCYGNLTWQVRLPSFCVSTTLPSESNNGESQSWTVDESTGVMWGSAGKRSMSDEISRCTIMITVDWRMKPKSDTNKKRNTIDPDDGNGPATSGDEVVQSSNTYASITCNDSQYWDENLEKCVNRWYRRWMPNFNPSLGWLALGLVIFIVAILLLTCCVGLGCLLFKGDKRGSSKKTESNFWIRFVANASYYIGRNPTGNNAGKDSSKRK